MLSKMRDRELVKEFSMTVEEASKMFDEIRNEAKTVPGVLQISLTPLYRKDNLYRFYTQRVSVGNLYLYVPLICDSCDFIDCRRSLILMTR